MLIRTAILLAGAVAGMVAAVAAARFPGYSPAAGSPVAVAAHLVAGGSLVVAAVPGARRRPGAAFRVLLGAAGVCWMLTGWTNPEIAVSAAFAAGLLLSPAVPVLTAHALLSYASSTRTRLMIAGYAGFALVAVGSGVLSDPRGSGCGTCPVNPLAIWHLPGAALWSIRAGMLMAAISMIGVAVVLCERLARASVARRRRLASLLVPGVAYLVAAAAAYGLALPAGYVSTAPPDTILWYAQAAALTAIALGTGVHWARLRRTRARLAALVVETAGSPPPGGLSDALARTLGDPGLRVYYPLDDGRLVDADGTPATPAREAAITRLTRGGALVALLAHRHSLFDDENQDESQIGALSAATRLALENERLRAHTRARLADLRASQTRIVQAGDAERRRLERDLHDGAQQRVVALSLSIRLARLRCPDAGRAALLEEAEAEVRAAVADLRAVAHGLYPGVLSSEGLAAAVDALADEFPLAAEGLSGRRYEPSVEAAAYLVVAESLKRGRPGEARLRAMESGDLLRLEIHLDGPLGDGLDDLRDRVGALDGTLEVLPLDGGETLIRVGLPATPCTPGTASV